MTETTNNANGISEKDEKLRRIEQRYNHHWELSEGESRGTTEALHGGWLAGAEYVLGVLGYDFDVTDDGKLEIKAQQVDPQGSRIAERQKGRQEMRNFNSSTLDNMVDRLERVIVTADGEVTEYTPEDAARKIAGIVFRKYVEGQRIRTTFEYDYHIGGQMLQRVRYDNGFVEKFEYVEVE